ncbi:hypothetical protein [Salinispora arenicola]|uniref:Uncharacterized protein n=1 Tax=Salinispora arenicola (strain CNS-205) TaxID=391037 RepID=A8M8F7_SALAI|nr:hypothetical protein [Salinispora arenicola]NIL63910.1 hypothetical protein [Salinispora arenicola]
MPVPEVTDDTRKPSLLTVLFRVGVALASVAALVLLVADSNGPLRVAAVLAILAIVLIGLSITMRPEDGGRVVRLREELEQLRHELHGEVVAAAQRGNQALDQVQRTQEAVMALGRRLDAGVATPGVSGGQRARVPVDESAGRAAVPDADRWGEHEGDRSRQGDYPPAEQYPGDRSATGRAGAYAAVGPGTGSTVSRPSAGGPGGAHAATGGPDGDHAAAGRHGGGYGAEPSMAGGHVPGDRPAGRHGTEPAVGTYGVRSPEPDGQRAAHPHGVVRHTETVHVTRHTVVDGGRNRSGTPYGGYDGGWSPGADARSWTGDGESRSWSGNGDGDGRSWSGGGDDRGGWAADGEWGESDELARPRPRQDGHDWANQPDDQEWANRPGGQGWADQPDDRGWGGARSWNHAVDQRGRELGTGEGFEDDYWSQLRAGGRWAAVREDDRGHELRVGERRAEVHTDRGGAEYRVADRWAAVRRDEPGPDPANAWRGGWSEPEERPALPPGTAPDEWQPPQQRQPEPRWSPTSGRYGRPDDRWR